MEIEEVINFLGTDTVYAAFTHQGLKFLSLRANTKAPGINLRSLAGDQERSPQEKMLIEETIKFLVTGRHKMPLDLTAFTDFQRRVFVAAGGIEPGEITTYKGIAEILGIPGGAQAVGNALAKNPVAYFIPTHRVLPQRGIGICRTGAGHLREKLLAHEGHDLSKLRGNYLCTRKKCIME